MNDPKSGNAGGPNSNKRTLIEEGTRIKGSLSSTCPMLVQGNVEGDVEGPAVTVSATGTISGKVTTSALKSEGKIAGEFDVDTAQVAGAVAHNTVVRATSLDVKLTAPSGKLELRFGPSRQN